MKGSYAQHSADTLEHQQGRNSAEINAAVAYGTPITNPYPSSSKEWLDWQIGYEAWGVPIVDEDDQDELDLLTASLIPTFTLDNLWI